MLSGRLGLLWQRAPAIATGAVLILAAVTKGLFPPGGVTMFGRLLAAHPLFAHGMIGLEAILGIFLIFGWRSEVASIAAVLLLAVFSGAIVHDMLQHYPIPCGCFGRAWQHAHEPSAIYRGLAIALVRNALLVLAVGYVFLTSGPHPIGTAEATPAMASVTGGPTARDDGPACKG